MILLTLYIDYYFHYYASRNHDTNKDAYGSDYENEDILDHITSYDNKRYNNI